jgi:acyl-[acyl carrier protein]--UDP-N-acetylglucosamine O-acyltransferase
MIVRQRNAALWQDAFRMVYYDITAAGSAGRVQAIEHFPVHRTKVKVGRKLEIRRTVLMRRGQDEARITLTPPW